MRIVIGLLVWIVTIIPLGMVVGWWLERRDGD